MHDVFSPFAGYPLSELAKKAPEKVSVGGVFYVLTRSYANRYLGVRNSHIGPWKKTAQEAIRFATVAAAIEFLKDSDFRDTTGIVRVTETPGKTTTRLVSTTKIDATKPVVIYGTMAREYWTGADGSFRWTTLSQARVFEDLNSALTEIQERNVYGPIHIHQVETATTEPTLVETVLE